MESYVKLRAIEGAVRGGIEGQLLYCRQSARIDGLIRMAKSKKIAIRKVSCQKLSEICMNDHHRGIVFISKDDSERESEKSEPYRKSLKDCLFEYRDRDSIVLILDGITDPHNLGAILRSADLFAVDFVILPRDRSARDGPVVAQTSAGASAHVTICEVTNVVRAIEEIKKNGYWVYGTEMNGESVASTAFNSRVAVVMGSEGHGMRRLVNEHCDSTVSIPSAGHIDSFNVSVATGIVLYEIRRRRGFCVVRDEEEKV